MLFINFVSLQVLCARMFRDVVPGKAPYIQLLQSTLFRTNGHDLEDTLPYPG